MAENRSAGGRGGRPPMHKRRNAGGPAAAGLHRRRRVCNFCVDGVKDLDYKDTNMLRRYVTERGQIRSRRKSGLCAKHQRRLARAVKRARYMALLPYTGEHMRLYGS